MRTLILILGLSFFSCKALNPKSNVDIQNPEPNYKVAIQFMNDYVDFCNDLTSKVGIIEWVNNRNDVTNDFKDELKRIITEAEKEGPELGLGSDPILDAQDHPNEFEIEKTDSEFIVVKGVDWPEFQLTLKLKYDGNTWLVDGSGIINVPENKKIER